MSDALAALVRLNLAASLAILLVLMLRRPTRAAFGARVAYGLWLLAPLAAAVMLAPARVVTLAAAQPTTEIVLAGSAAPIAAARTPPSLDATPWLLGLWAAGALACALWLARAQLQFRRAARAGVAGPAAIGLLRPRIVLPADFEHRYTSRERQVILAHERTHIVRGDPRINALVAAARCAAWFNPLVHLAARLLRIDQELACDAQVVAAHPAARRAYAEAMLKTQLAARPLPLGCYWPASGAHPLAERIGLLGRAPPGHLRQAMGIAAIALLALTGAAAAWAARPPHVELRAPAPVKAANLLPVRPAQALAAPAVVQPRQPERHVETAAEATPLLAAEKEPILAEASGPQISEPAQVFKIRGVAERSHVEPGFAVRVVAAMTDPDGHRLVTDLTAFGSHAFYRTGYFERDGSRYSLFTGVEQRGDVLYVTASLGRHFAPATSGTIPLASGQTGTIVLDNGQAVTVTPILRRETPEEVAEGQRWGERRAERPLIERAAFTPDPFRCGRRDAVC